MAEGQRGGLSILRVVSNEDLNRMEEEKATADALAERQAQPFL